MDPKKEPAVGDKVEKYRAKGVGRYPIPVKGVIKHINGGTVTVTTPRESVTCGGTFGPTTMTVGGDHHMTREDFDYEYRPAS